ncbi:endoplasmic reticulum metallopeptidase 1-like [Saccostrea echinata]|uniref:endoplasmic reticulum metallopeptidase 1-like n=1 Tax=Saccostrea echinata TaxID=191078 RepID=UPI002A82885E|nr:endoplasmic reticulum metallopeptidase 1-like [Saccostrea echinata]
MESSARKRHPKGRSKDNVIQGVGGVDDTEDKPNNPKINFNSYALFSVYLGTAMLIYLLMYLLFHSFPTPLKGEACLSEKLFCEERARFHLENITNFGPRVAGSYANEVKAKDYLMKEVRKIQEQLHASKKMEIDLQITSGSFHLVNFIQTNFYSVYRNMQNIVVKISEQEESEDSFLINCHHDSVSSSPGAGDNAVSCSVMLEIIRIISRSPFKLKHNVIFLFNGAEENMLQASHGFITQHKWVKSIKTVINLDSAGAGGWEVVFQTGPEHPWLVAAYAESVPHPFGSVIGQEFFELGLIPSDTDFRIFRDFGRIPGLDIAHIANGYIYHTMYDQPKYIPSGCLQRAGDNLLALILKLASNPKLADPGLDRHGSMIFIDVFGIFMVHYPLRIGQILNYLAVVLCFLHIYKTSARYSMKELNAWSYVLLVLCFVLTSLLSWVLCILLLASFGLITSMSVRAMFWFTHNTNIFSVFVVPSLAVILRLHQYFRDYLWKKISPSIKEEIHFDASLVIWSIFTVLLTAAGLASAFLPMLWILPPLVIREYVAYYIKPDWQSSPLSYLLVTLSSIAIPTLIMMEIFFGMFSLLVPIMGRSGTSLPPDVAIAVITSLFVCLYSQYLVGATYLCSNMKSFLVFLTSCFVVGVLVVIFTPLGFPFSGNPNGPSPKRVLPFHMHRKFHDKNGLLVKEDSGLWNLPMDYIGADLFHDNEFIKKSQRKECDGPNCGLPYLIPIGHMLDPSLSLYFMNNEDPDVNPLVKLKLIERRNVLPEIERFTFQALGPDHMTMYIVPPSGVQLVDWSIDRGHPTPVSQRKGTNETLYFVYYSHGLQPDTPWEFYLDFKMAEKTDIVTEIVMCGHYLHGDQHITPLLQRFIHSLPDWAAPNPWVVTYNLYQF